MSKIRTEVNLIEKNGRTLSQRKEFNEEGILVRDGIYAKSLGSWGWNIPIGDVKSYYDNGKKKSEEHYDEAGALNGEARYYTKEGEVEKILMFVDGKEIKKAP